MGLVWLEANQVGKGARKETEEEEEKLGIDDIAYLARRCLALGTFSDCMMQNRSRKRSIVRFRVRGVAVTGFTCSQLSI